MRAGTFRDPVNEMSTGVREPRGMRCLRAWIENAFLAMLDWLALLLVRLRGCSAPRRYNEPMRLTPILLLAACSVADSFPEPDDWATSGPGGPARSFAESELWSDCASLTGGPEDVEHHNLVVMHDGYLLMPWVPEDGGGGLTFFDISDPCAPEKVGEAFADRFRESHTMAIGRVGDRDLLAVDSLSVDANGDPTGGGMGLWDITDPTEPFWITDVEIPGFDYPDAYFFVSLSTFFQGDLVYVSAGFLGLFVVDVSDPEQPEVIADFDFESDAPMLLGSFHVIGDTAFAFNAGTAPSWTVDLSVPTEPSPLAYFDVEDGEGEVAPYYFANMGGKYALFARKNQGGGPIVYDVSDPSEPTFAGDFHTEDGSGGYVFRHEDSLFVGDSNFASVYDFADPAAMTERGRMNLVGDLDTITPIGNVAVLSVDSGAEAGRGSVVVPWQMEPDSRGPVPELHFPVDEAKNVALTARIGVSFDEMIEGASVFDGSFRVTDKRGRAVSGTLNTQEAIANFTPDEPLQPRTTYVITLPAAGVADTSGNAMNDPLSFTFTTQDEP